MGAYLDRLNGQFDEIRDGIDALVSRAADEDRDVSETEQHQVDRDRARLDELQTAITHYTALETQQDAVSNLRRSVVDRTPVQRSTAPQQPEEYDVAREFPTAADYAITLHRAWALHDPEARERLERATAHQKTTDNPGLIPRPVLGPVINLIDGSRPFINSVARKALPAGKFDRPHITQHVSVAKQPNEKDLTASQVLQAAYMPVTAATYAGHLNISRQDVKWTSPGILQLVFDDFATIYAQVTNADAVAQFVASVTNTAVPIAGGDPGDLTGAIYGAVANALGTGIGFPDTMWVSPDVWASMGSMSAGLSGAPAFPSLSVTSSAGNPLGLRLVVDWNFPDGTMIIGPSNYAEWYEDVDGLMQVQEPDVLGQLVGYAGYGAFLNAAPEAFTPLTGLPAAPAAASSSSGGSSSSSK